MAVQIINIKTGKTELSQFFVSGRFSANADNIMNAGGLAVFFAKRFGALNIKLAANQRLFYARFFQMTNRLIQKRRART